MLNCALLSAQKEEGPFVLEFVAHHLALGVSDIFIITNPSTDGTNELAEVLAEAGAIRHYQTDTPSGEKPQDYAFATARRLFGLDSFEWLLILDCDELLNIHTGDGNVNNFLNGFEPAVDLVSVNTACFGNRPHFDWHPTMSTNRFRFRLASGDWRSGVAKTFIHHPSNFGRLRPHGPQGFKLERKMKIAFYGGLDVQDVDPADPSVYQSLRRPGSFDGVHRLAQINHYLIRTWDSFQLRSMRGRGAMPVGSINARHTRKYFQSYSKACVLDCTISRYEDRFASVLGWLLSIHNVRTCFDKVNEIYLDRLASLNAD